MGFLRRKDRKPSRLSRQVALGNLEVAMGRVQERAIPAGARIYTSWSPKVRYAHLKSAVNPGSACETFSTREEPWLGTGSDDEREHAASLPLCPKCQAAVGAESRAAS